MSTKEVTGGCSKCFETTKGYFLAESGRKLCKDCGGTYLSLQEVFDHLAELQSEVRSLQELLGLVNED
jgi:hypothetical protein